MNLWLDDVRPAPPGWLWVKTVAQAQAILRSEAVQWASLDHDLGSIQDGTDLVLWMVDTDTWPAHKPVVHSANPVGADRMRRLIDQYGPYDD